MKTTTIQRTVAAAFCAFTTVGASAQQSGGLPALQTDLNNEISRATGVEAALQSADLQLQRSIDAGVGGEKGMREDADRLLKANLDAETAARVAASTALQGVVAAETARAGAAETGLQLAIDAEGAARAQALAAEVAARQATCGAEAAARETAITGLQAQIAALQDSLAAARQVADLLRARETLSAVANRIAQAEAVMATVYSGSTDFATIQPDVIGHANVGMTGLDRSLALLANAASFAGNAEAAALNAAAAQSQQAAYASVSEATNSTTQAARDQLTLALRVMAEAIQQQQAAISTLLSN